MSNVINLHGQSEYQHAQTSGNNHVATDLNDLVEVANALKSNHYLAVLLNEDGTFSVFFSKELDVVRMIGALEFAKKDIMEMTPPCE